MTGKETALLWIERLCRIGMGVLFIYSAAMKIDDPGLFADAVSRYEFLPEFSIGVFSLTMSMLELIVGVALVAPSPQGRRALFVGVECAAGGTFMASASAMAADGSWRRGVDSACLLSGAAAGR